MIVENNYCVILAGGTGNRLWPQSRMNRPKQFIDFFGTGYSLLQQTYYRFEKIVPKENILVITNVGYADIVKEQLPDLDEANILLEPARRNTSPCVAWAAYHIRCLNPLANMIVAPVDQLIMREDEFRQAMLRGLEFVSRSDSLLTVGIKPTRPETAFGYIQIAEEMEPNVYKVKSFTEKPELEFAKLFVESGEFYWNSGLFIWNVNAILKAINKLLPEIASFINLSTGQSTEEAEREFVEKHFASCPNISIDYGILEKADNVCVLKGSFGWSDLGGWDTFYDVAPKDMEDNVVIRSKALLYNCHGNVVSVPSGKLVVVKDLDDCLVVEADNVLVICKRDDTVGIRQFVNDVQVKLGDDYL